MLFVIAAIWLGFLAFGKKGLQPGIGILLAKIAGIWLALQVGLFATELFPILLFGRVLFPLLGLWGIGVVIIRWRRARLMFAW